VGINELDHFVVSDRAAPGVDETLSHSESLARDLTAECPENAGPAT
jgi:hypothetical protein